MTASADVKRPPSFGITLGTILFPALLMLSKAVVDLVYPGKTHNPAVGQTFKNLVGDGDAGVRRRFQLRDAAVGVLLIGTARTAF